MRQEVAKIHMSDDHIFNGNNLLVNILSFLTEVSYNNDITHNIGEDTIQFSHLVFTFFGMLHHSAVFTNITYKVVYR